ncbi:hypothetical protein QQX98_005533 [Neonectria punicea]|uniref:Fungal N-terminal domain-containing protein n=1 Tax=Neonectria punicea TaxID=979145 RepID=A0ABR1H4C1_9HYPO
MDPASLAFGVVSLAMQLVQATAAIQKLIATYKAPAKELSSLSDKLGDIEAIYYSLEAALNCYERTPKPWDAILLKKLQKTMTDCRDKVARLYSIISAITAGLTKKHRPFNTIGKIFLHDGLLTLSTTVTAAATTAYAGSSEASLFGLAIEAGDREISKFLMEQIPDISQRSHMSPNSDFNFRFNPLKRLDCTRAYIDMRRDSLSPFEFYSLIRNHDSNAYYVHSCINACKPYLFEHWQTFILQIWGQVVEAFVERWGGGPFKTEEWASIIAEAIADGLDVHTKTWGAEMDRYNGLSALSYILYETDTTDEALENLQAWVNLLENSGVDIQRYLDIETEHCASTWDANETYRQWNRPWSMFSRQFVVRESKARQLPCWIEMIDDSCIVRELFTEYPHLKEGISLKFRFPSSDVKEQHRAWKTPDWHTEQHDYPVYPPLDRGDLILLNRRGFSAEWDASIEADRAGLERVCNLMESRFERKQAKKMWKVGCSKRLKFQSRMPGTWVDE